MKKTIFTLLAGYLLFASCTKDNFAPPPTIQESCIAESGNPAGSSYTVDSVVAFTCTSKHCGILPLSSKNYWVYEDSIFDNGILLKVQLDTFRFVKNYKSLTDDLIWWESNISIGLPDRLYANDSSIFKMEDRFFTPDVIDAKKDFSLFAGDSIRYLANFQDAAAIGRSVKIQSAIDTRAGVFTDYILFEKNARNYRKDQVYFKPGIGVIKYIQEKAPMGMPLLKLQQVSTLISFHIE